jgi:P4 family phage/plasmid primase-like protien
MNAPKNIGEILNKLTRVKKLADGWQADCPCPGHDSPAGHLSVKDAADKALVTCFNQHNYDDICKALGYESLSYSNGAHPTNLQRQIVAVYPYHNEKGAVLFEVCRFQPKGFAQRRTDGTWGLQGVTPVLYHLPSVKQAVSTESTVFICEGEKDADNVVSKFSVTATCNPMGAGKWRTGYSQSLVGAAGVVIIADNDAPGRKHAQEVAASLQSIKVPCKILDMPKPGIKDISDWINDGLTADEFSAAVAQLPLWTPHQQVAKEPEGFRRTDLGNAERLIAACGKDIRYSYERKSWLIWRGTHWQWDAGGEIMKLAQKAVRKIYAEAAEEENEDERKKTADWAKASESNQRLNAMVTQTQPLVSIRPDELDANYWVLNCKNGTVDLKTGELHPHNPVDYLTMICSVDYDADAPHPLWDKFLARVTAENTSLISYMQKCMGYSLTGETKEQVLFFIHGPGQNGKSTFMDTFIEILGPYATQANIEMFLAQYKPSSSGHNEDVANLAGKRLVVASEIEEGRKLAVPKIKQMTGGERVRASHKYEHEFEYQVTYKIWLNGNHKPEITDTTFSIWRRVKLLPLPVIIPPEERDRNLRHKLRLEYAGILAWAVQGCLDWQQEGIEDPLVVSTAVEDYRQESDILGDFIRAKCFPSPHDAECVVSQKDLYAAYQSWCGENSIDAVTSRTFAKRLREKGSIKKFISMGQLKWRYIRLLKENEEPQTSRQAVDVGDLVGGFSRSILHEENYIESLEKRPPLSLSSTTQSQPKSGLSTSSTVNEEVENDDIKF